MAIPGLKDFNRLLSSAQSEVAAWSLTPGAASTRRESLDYVLGLLDAIQDSDHVGSLKAAFANVFATVELFGVPVSEVAPSLVRLSTLLAEREQKHPLKD
jgi:hypothetical protein